MSKCCLFKVLVLFIEYQRIYLLLFINKPLQPNDYAIPLDEGTYEAIDEQTSTFGKYNDEIKNIKLP